MKKILPEQVHWVVPELAVAGYDREILCHRGRDEKAVEGIFVGERQFRNRDEVIRTDGNFPEAVASQFLRYAFRPTRCEPEIRSIQRNFDRHFPERNLAPVYFFRLGNRMSCPCGEAGIVGNQPQDCVGIEQEAHGQAR